MARQTLIQQSEGKRLSGNRGILRREKKTNLAFRLKFFNELNYMAKSIHLHEIETETFPPTLSAGSFWGHWFEIQARRRAAAMRLDEHRIWEKAVNFDILAM